ncbi:hypothetical protein [Pseudomonas viridiflava]|uniref:hypothetical protein n=1 Tax=Pseudomonas viridiflava TaxID=33069 RepID=UPI000F03E106|nr:hypothetical protein [Pseudomonas viridiflava]
MGIDVDLLAHLAADDLLDEYTPDRTKLFAAGAVYQLGACINMVLEPNESKQFCLMRCRLAD